VVVVDTFGFEQGPLKFGSGNWGGDTTASWQVKGEAASLARLQSMARR